MNYHKHNYKIKIKNNLFTPLLIEINCKCLAIQARFLRSSVSKGAPACMSIMSCASGEHNAEFIKR